MDQTSSTPLPTGRIVVLAEMEDGTVRALDGEAHGLIEVRNHIDDRFWEVGPKIAGRTTTVTITYPGQWTMYQSKHPDAPSVSELAPSPKKVSSHGC